MFALLNSNIKVNKIICSDINNDLISLWLEIKNNPIKLIEEYTKHWDELNKDNDIKRKKEYYYMIRDRFNESRSPYDFIFINRTTTNGLIRYNKKGNFNNSFHISRKGIKPENLKQILKKIRG